ncbi:MAG: hypothetical protein NTU61_05235 [Candidatus Altiarchaeota archaeon]|nr:hypothetical protein [Candidatus Altiarchaeota archaeon]
MSAQKRKRKPEEKKEGVDLRLIEAEEDVQKLLNELSVREATPMGSRMTPFEEEMGRLRPGRGGIKGRKL